jgi:hypothetical protein
VFDEVLAPFVPALAALKPVPLVADVADDAPPCSAERMAPKMTPFESLPGGALFASPGTVAELVGLMAVKCDVKAIPGWRTDPGTPLQVSCQAARARHCDFISIA